ncbi:MAG: hypothetical protein L3J78_01650 [Thermoplasmata archaeon]|nr:hypothetical protein [Thermoplasmata archaeon]
MASKELDRLFAVLPTFEHQKGIRLFDEAAKDPANAAPILQELLAVDSNHDDPQLHTPHGLLTVHAGWELLRLTRPPRGLGLLRFLVLYNFSLQKRPLTAAAVEAEARLIPPASREEKERAYRKFVHDRIGAKAGPLLARIALDHGLEAAGHLAIRTSLDDLGRLGHNLAVSVGYADTASALGLPRGLVPIANLGYLQATGLQGVDPAVIVSDGDGNAGKADVGLLARLVEDWEFDRVESTLTALAFEGRAEEAYRPLLVATSADPGFLGHTLSVVHAARIATRYLTPSENAWLSWKLYRTLTTRFGYPEFLRLGEPQARDRPSILTALQSSLRYKSPPAEETVRHALEAEVPLEEILATVVDFYGQWTVGEKEHTISYLNAVLQTAKFLGKDEALLPLAIGLSKLPF